jgi:hypothetical protein
MDLSSECVTVLSYRASALFTSWFAVTDMTTLYWSDTGIGNWERRELEPKELIMKRVMGINELILVVTRLYIILNTCHASNGYIRYMAMASVVFNPSSIKYLHTHAIVACPALWLPWRGTWYC